MSAESSSPSVEITQSQRNAAHKAGQEYFWRVTLESGKEVDQFDPVTGVEQQFPNWVVWVDKSPDDPYHGTPVFSGIKYAYWLPVRANYQAHGIDADGASGVIIFRKRYVRPTGLSYTAYCIGQRFESDNPIEIVYHICPAARYDPVLDIIVDRSATEGVLFGGGITKVTVPNGANAFDQFLAQAR